jgi:hypothetical protein
MTAAETGAAWTPREVVRLAVKKGLSPLSHTRWILGVLCLGVLPACDWRMPDLSTGFAAEAAPAAITVPRAPDPLANFAATATPGSVGNVNGERARMTRAYNAASGRECREIILGAGQGERTAVACRDASGNFVSAQPLLRGSFR